MLAEMNRSALVKFIVGAAFVAYGIGLVFADILFLNMVQKAFPNSILAGFAVVGALTAAITGFVLPAALHKWFAPGTQRGVGLLFYVVDFLMMGLNCILAMQLMWGNVDPIIALWKQISPATPVICAAFWGWVFAVDPSNKLEQTRLAMQSRQIDMIARGMELGMHTPGAVNYLAQIGNQSMWHEAYKFSGLAAPVPDQQQLPQPQTIVTQVPNTVTGQLQAVQLAQTAQLQVPPARAGLRAAIRRWWNGPQQAETGGFDPDMLTQFMQAFINAQQAQNSAQVPQAQAAPAAPSVPVAIPPLVNGPDSTTN